MMDTCSRSTAIMSKEQRFCLNGNPMKIDRKQRVHYKRNQVGRSFKMFVRSSANKEYVGSPHFVTRGSPRHHIKILI